MGWCFWKHGILPSQYRKLNDTDKLIMLAAIDYFEEIKGAAINGKNSVGKHNTLG